MRKLTSIALLALVLVACGEQKASQPSWEEFAATTVAEYYEHRPESAVNVGLHEYDGQMSDKSKAGTATQIAWFEQVVADASGYTDLEGIEAFERDYLLTAMRGRLFWLRDSGFQTNNPLNYVRFGVSVYVDREYAPLEERIQAYTRYIEQVPAALQTMRDNLELPLPAPYVKVSHGILTGFAGYLESTVPALFSSVEDEQLQRQFVAANGDAVDAVRQAATWLEGLKATATDDYALGEERFLKMLRDTQGVDITLA
jgi:hypothetical protein